MPTVPEYPEEDWMSQLGTTNGSRQRFARSDVLPDQPTPTEVVRAKGGLDYDVIQQKLGKNAADIMREWDQSISDPKSKVDQQLRDKWEKAREFWMQMFQEGQGPSTPTPRTRERAVPGYSTPWSVQG